MTSSRRLRRAMVLPVVVWIAIGALSACSDHSPAAMAVPIVTTSTTPPSLLPAYPLTGLPVTDPSTAARPALHVKISNEVGAFPQSGLNAADVVYEEIIEGGETRYLAIFQSQNADPVGPVRSVRPTDPKLIAPFGGLFGYSGGAPQFVELLRQTPGIVDLGPSNASSAYRDRPVHRISWQNHYTTTEALYAQAPAGLSPPQPFSPFLKPGQPFSSPGGVPALKFDVPFGASTAQWEWDPAKAVWNRSHGGEPDVLEDGARETATTVIVQFVPYAPSEGSTDITGAQVYDAQLIGSGDAWIFANGALLKGKWSKSSEAAVTAYTDAAGAPVGLPAGRTWVELPRPDTAVTTEPAPPVPPG